ncbi:FMN-dependent NADH-azoreductase [Nostoc sp. FACHB-152]|uniref:FMN-dependent NADH-azoreductase n=1 Tax=unclassified Nostoc TaxID=2593658 RepID=UPI001686E41E|nr:MULTISPECIES: FMN-dependent NADH-azoreductase [unclassified Nostoc]MBD2451680.1 FMN-dependent NADH-azoreductase [Nostoc sp. FACHB-152]MBD2472782.1 FMN-dependent NADH-azoreductase [Nostoc sp. FACHB-145]
MANILHIDSSPRGERSISRSLSYEFITSWKDTHPGDTVTYRDLGHHPVPHVDESWIAAAFTPPETHTPVLTEAIKLSESLIDEFLAADLYVFGVPMYNLNIPSTFKAYIDQIVRVGRTFAVGENGYIGLVDSSKKVLIITSRGGAFSPGTPFAPYDYQEPYLRAILGFIGLTDVTFINAENLNSGDDARQKSLEAAKEAIAQAVANW